MPVGSLFPAMTTPQRPTPGETLLLWRRFKERGCQRSRAALIDAYSYLVPRSRGRVAPALPPKLAPGDLDGEGYLALVRAVDHFDPGRKVKFESYAISAIRGAMLEYLRREDWAPRSVRQKQRTLSGAAAAAREHHPARGITDADMARELDLPLDAFYELSRKTREWAVFSLTHTVHSNQTQGFGTERDLEIEDTVADPAAPSPEALALETEQADKLRELLSWLPETERTVLVLYYREDRTFKQIASVIGRSESRVHQLHVQALRRLRGYQQHAGLA